MTLVTPELLRAHPLPSHDDGGAKEARGTVLVVGGSVEVPGGALLAAVGALRAGAGKLQIATVQSAAVGMGLHVPEALVMGLPETDEGGIAPEAVERVARRAVRADAVLVGPGMMDPDATTAFVAALLPRLDGQALVLDAGALAGLRAQRDALRAHAGRTVITPHAGEMARLLDVSRETIEADPASAARQTAALLGCTVVMKGASTHVVTPAGETWLFEGGTVGLATSGSGDTLAGVVTGLAARGAAPLWAAIWGVYLHGTAGCRLMDRHGGVGFLARELLAEIPGLMAELR